MQKSNLQTKKLAEKNKRRAFENKKKLAQQEN